MMGFTSPQPIPWIVQFNFEQLMRWMCRDITPSLLSGDHPQVLLASISSHFAVPLLLNCILQLCFSSPQKLEKGFQKWKQSFVIKTRFPARRDGAQP